MKKSRRILVLLLTVALISGMMPLQLLAQEEIFVPMSEQENGSASEEEGLTSEESGDDKETPAEDELPSDDTDDIPDLDTDTESEEDAEEANGVDEEVPIIGNEDCITSIMPNGIVNMEDFQYEVNDDGETITIIEYKGNDSSITVPEMIDDMIVTGISDTFRYNITLTEISLPNTIDKLENYAFAGCEKLEEITIPENVISIGISVFWGCKSLKEIKVEDDNEYFISEEGILFSENKELVICYPAAKEGTNYDIPEGVLTIGTNAF